MDDLSINEELNNGETANNDYSKINIEYLAKIIDLCKEKNVSIYLIRTPLHPNWLRNNERLFAEIKSTIFNDTDFLDYSDLKFEDDKYGDHLHLNWIKAHMIFLFGLIKN